jgi:hypothetical protein
MEETIWDCHPGYHSGVSTLSESPTGGILDLCFSQKIASKLPLYHSIKRHHDIRFGAVQQDEPLLQFMELLNDTTAAAAGKSMVDARIEEPTQETLTSVTSGRVIDTITVFLDGSEDDLVTLPARSWSVKEGLLQTLSNLLWP